MENRQTWPELLIYTSVDKHMVITLGSLYIVRRNRTDQEEKYENLSRMNFENLSPPTLTSCEKLCMAKNIAKSINKKSVWIVIDAFGEALHTPPLRRASPDKQIRSPTEKMIMLSVP